MGFELVPFWQMNCRFGLSGVFGYREIEMFIIVSNYSVKIMFKEILKLARRLTSRLEELSTRRESD